MIYIYILSYLEMTSLFSNLSFSRHSHWKLPLFTNHRLSPRRRRAKASLRPQRSLQMRSSAPWARPGVRSFGSARIYPMGSNGISGDPWENPWENHLKTVGLIYGLIGHFNWPVIHQYIAVYSLLSQLIWDLYNRIYNDIMCITQGYIGDLVGFTAALTRFFSNQI